MPYIKSFETSRLQIFLFIFLFGGLLISFNSLIIAAQQPPPDQKVQLSKIEVKGLQRYKPEQIIAASGLQIGQEVDVSALDAAAQKIVDSGLVKNLRYRFHSSNGQATVTFEVEEASASVPVVFDNFVWFKPQELISAIRQDMPSFDGTLPEGGAAAETVSKSLERLLRARGINGRVEYTLSTPLNSNQAHYLFSVKGAHLPICKIHYAGASGIPEVELMRASRQVIGEDYSQEFVEGFVESSILPLYHQRGHLRASFSQPSAQILAGAENCPNGVSVNVPIDPGSVYVLNGIEWEGNSALSGEELTAAVGMRPNEIANGLKIEKGLEAAQLDYGKKGYIAAKLQATPVFDDSARRVSYRVKVTEGEQYRMGSLVIEGLPDEDAEKVKAKWELSPGSVYDVSYIGQFVKKSLPTIRFESAKQFNIEAKEKPDPQHKIVDVTLVFK